MSLALEEAIRTLFARLKSINDRVFDLESEHGEVHGFHFGDRFPTQAYPNQIVVRVDETPPDGGVMYRYDEASLSWKRLN